MTHDRLLVRLKKRTTECLTYTATAPGEAPRELEMRTPIRWFRLHDREVETLLLSHAATALRDTPQTPS